MPLAAGTRLGPYAIVSHLETGGMAEVYAARDVRSGRRVAVKVLAAKLAASPLARERFDREARALTRLDHGGVCRLLEAGRTHADRYMALEFLEGETLASRLGRGPLSLPEALRIARRVASILDAVHAAGIVHGDLKPANLMLSPEGEITLFDFGLARSSSRGNEWAESGPESLAIVTRSSEIVLGTPAYMPPESFRSGPADPRSDVWGLGLVVFEMLSGRPAFSRRSAREILDAVTRDAPPWEDLPSSTPEPAVAFLRRALRKNPSDRWESAAAARAALDAIAAEALAGE